MWSYDHDLWQLVTIICDVMLNYNPKSENNKIKIEDENK